MSWLVGIVAFIALLLAGGNLLFTVLQYLKSRKARAMRDGADGANEMTAPRPSSPAPEDLERKIEQKIARLQKIVDQCNEDIRLLKQGLQVVADATVHAAPPVEMRARQPDALQLSRNPTGPVDVQNMFAQMIGEVEGVLFKPIEFAQFMKTRKVYHLELTPDGTLKVLDRSKSTRESQWFLAVEDDASGLCGLFFGPKIHNSAEAIRQNPHIVLSGFESWFEVRREGRKPQLITPAIVQVQGDDVRLGLKGRIGL
jgi:hypothetical protein